MAAREGGQRVVLTEGQLCPKCGQGRLVVIGDYDDTIVLRCFMCETTASTEADGVVMVHTERPRHTPGGLVTISGNEEQGDPAGVDADPNRPQTTPGGLTPSQPKPAPKPRRPRGK